MKYFLIIYKKYKPNFWDLENEEQIKGDIASTSWVLIEERLEAAVKNFNSLDLDRQAEPLLDSLWRTGFDFYPYIEGIHNIQYSSRGDKIRNDRLAVIEEKKDWRKILEKRGSIWNKQ